MHLEKVLCMWDVLTHVEFSIFHRPLGQCSHYIQKVLDHSGSQAVRKDRLQNITQGPNNA